jgi:hypothetical protein
MVLDPNANRGLFNVSYFPCYRPLFLSLIPNGLKSTLAIIIKDVTNSDANDIVKEYAFAPLLGALDI